MSARNGDKARYHRQKTMRRVRTQKYRELKKELAATAAKA